MNIKKQIAELNNEVRCTLKPSKIHGVGVFTLRDIKKGERLYVSPSSSEHRWYNIPFESLEALRPEIRSLILERWPLILHGASFDGPNNIRLMSFMNHSDKPNSKYDLALRDISEGEEITEDYRVVEDYKKIYKFL